MKKLLLASAALMALSVGGNAVQAADMPVKAPPVVVWNWSGCYVGVQAGYKWGKSEVDYGQNTLGRPVGSQANDDITLNGALGGGTVGCQYQWGTWVWGVEGDFSWRKPVVLFLKRNLSTLQRPCQ